jgi:GAF domain-containing protein
MSAAPLSEALKALSRFLVADASFGDTLQRVSEITVDAVGPAEFLGISMLDADGRPTTGIYTDPASPAIDEGQYSSGRGPCLDAWHLGRTVRVDDIDAAVDAYPDFCEAARAHGIGSTMSLPLAAGESRLGALNLYASRPGGFAAEDEELASELATAAAVVLANAAAFWNAQHLNEQLTTAMQSRAVIEQAKGILMARSAALDADGAFDVLRRASQRENVKLRAIAERIVADRSLEPDDPIDMAGS